MLRTWDKRYPSNHIEYCDVCLQTAGADLGAVLGPGDQFPPTAHGPQSGRGPRGRGPHRRLPPGML